MPSSEAEAVLSVFWSVKMQEMCERLIAEHQSLDTLNAENCLEEIEQMEKEGARFMEIGRASCRERVCKQV